MFLLSLFCLTQVWLILSALNVTVIASNLWKPLSCDEVMGSGGQLDGWLEEREEEETMNLKDAAYYVPFEKVNDEFVRQTISLQNVTLRLPFSFDSKIKATISVDGKTLPRLDAKLRNERRKRKVRRRRNKADVCTKTWAAILDTKRTAREENRKKRKRKMSLPDDHLDFMSDHLNFNLFPSAASRSSPLTSQSRSGFWKLDRIVWMLSLSSFISQRKEQQ